MAVAPPPIEEDEEELALTLTEKEVEPPVINTIPALDPVTTGEMHIVEEPVKPEPPKKSLKNVPEP